MVIKFEGKNCSDCCPLFHFNMRVEADKITVEAPRCGLAGHKDGEGRIVDIRLKYATPKKGELLPSCPRPKECPFNGMASVEISR